MRITIENVQGHGPVDYTAFLDGAVVPTIVRKMNRPSELRFGIVENHSGSAVAGARVVLSRDDGRLLFTGYLTQAARAEYVGSGEKGSVYRYELVAESDEVLLDQKALPNRAPFIHRSAGAALRQLAENAMPGFFDTSGVQDLDTLAVYVTNPQKAFSYHAAEIALSSRACYRAMNGALLLEPVGANTYEINESDQYFSPAGLKLESPNRLVNDVTVIGLDEPQAYVRDYFVGDGMSLRFYLSQTPFPQLRPALIDEEYAAAELDATVWIKDDPAGATAVVAQALQVAGGTGVDGDTTVVLVDDIELGGALELQHGDISVNGPSQGVVGGLYAGEISAAGCLAGFQLSPNGAASNIQALINGVGTGPVVTTTTGHRYVMTTYLYSMEVYRAGQGYHSASHPAGSAWGGAEVPTDVRVVLQIQDINPVMPSSMVAAATILYDGVLKDAPGFCRYALVNAGSLQCSIAYTYARHISLSEVRMALPNANYETVPVGSLSDGAPCTIVSSTTLDFYPQFVPPLNSLIVASYRGYGRAVAEVVNGASVASLENGEDDGVRSLVRTLKAPSTRTQMDCENAALAILDNGAVPAWSGTYTTWSDFLPGGAEDIFPGDAVSVNVPSLSAEFSAIARTVTIAIEDPAGDRGMYTIEFANDLAEPLSYQDAATGTAVPLQDKPPRLDTTQVGASYAANLTEAQILQVSSTTVTVDLGMSVPSGCGVEVRAHDFGWGVANDRNLLGRFSEQTFTLARLAHTQTYFLRLYDNSSPRRYSRYAAALHLDYPL